MSKLEYAKCAAASLAYMILHQQDSVGLVTFDREIRALVRPRQQSFAPEGNAACHGGLGGRAEDGRRPDPARAGRALQKAGIVIIFSDLLDDVDAILAGLKHFRHRRHEVVLFHVLDPAEVDFPFDEMMLFRGLEGCPSCWPSRALAAGLSRTSCNKFTHRLKQGCRQQRIDYVLVRTDQSLEVVLSSYLASRR